MILAYGYVADSLITFTDEVAALPDSVSAADDPGVRFQYIRLRDAGKHDDRPAVHSRAGAPRSAPQRKEGTLKRILAAPVTAGQAVAGKVGAAFAITMIAALICLAVSGIGFGVDLGDPFALSLEAVAVIMMCTGVMTFLYGAISNERAADALMSVVIMVMALFGGSMVPVEQMPPSLQAAGRFSPVFWAADGMKQIFLHDAGVNDIRMHLLILFLIGVCTIIPGVLLIRARIAKGRW